MFSTANKLFIKFTINIFVFSVLWLSICLFLSGCHSNTSEPPVISHYQVLSVHDGDTLTLINRGQKLKVRIFGIDCPELTQPFGKAARARLKDLVFEQQLLIDVINTDQYGRTVAKVFLADGSDLGKILISAGLAYWYRKFAPDRKDYEIVEENARKAKIGLWSQRTQAPWQYRYQQREKKQ